MCCVVKYLSIVSLNLICLSLFFIKCRYFMFFFFYFPWTKLKYQTIRSYLYVKERKNYKFKVYLWNLFSIDATQFKIPLYFGLTRQIIKYKYDLEIENKYLSSKQVNNLKVIIIRKKCLITIDVIWRQCFNIFITTSALNTLNNKTIFKPVEVRREFLVNPFFFFVFILLSTCEDVFQLRLPTKFQWRYNVIVPKLKPTKLI